MSTPYLVEIRTGGAMKSQLRDIIYDVADTFNVQGAAEPRAVPHITLFGPYGTRRGGRVKTQLLDILEDYDVVPYRVDGFDTFPENNVIYAKVIPSPELRSLRREISRKLRPLCTNFQSHESNFFYNYHITIAFRDVGRKFDDILDYVRSNYDPQFDSHATRITNLNRFSMLWEYDLPNSELLERDEATSAEAWERTDEALREKALEIDESDLSPKPWFLKRWADVGFAKMRFKW